MIDDNHSSEDRERLIRMHEARTTDPATLSAIVQEAIEGSIVDKERIIEGEVNEVYSVELQDGNEVMLRISRHKESNFPPEAWAIEQARKIGIPVPKVLAFGTYQTEQKPLHYSIEEKIKGRSLNQLLWTDHIPRERARVIIAETGEILAKIHDISTPGYGRIDEHGKGRYESVKDLMVSERLSLRDKYTKLLIDQGLSQSTIDTVFAEFEEAGGLLAQPHLLHFDYAPKHMFVDSNYHINGIIDWEDAVSNDIAFEFAGWQFWFNDHSDLPIDWLFEGYKKYADLGDNFEKRFKIARLYRLTGLVNYYTNEFPYPKWAKTGAEAISELVSHG